MLSWSWSWSWCWRWCWRRPEPYHRPISWQGIFSLLKWVLLQNRYITSMFFFSIIASTPFEAILKTVCRKLISLYILRRCVDPPAHRRGKPQNSWLGLMFVVRTSTTLFEEPMFSHLRLTGEDASEQANQWFNQFFQKVDVIYDFDFHFWLFDFDTVLKG